jgi:type II secretory pathway pseudopilin PulG
MHAVVTSPHSSETEDSIPSPSEMRFCVAKARKAGFSLIQVVVAMGVISIAGAAGITALVQLNNKAAAMRTLNNARAIVQRNIDTALAVSFSASQQPAILATTSVAGVVHDDDGGGDNLVTIHTPKTAGGMTLKGTLTRIVTTQANSDSADIRRITFRINYTVRGRPFSYAMTTVRGSD